MKKGILFLLMLALVGVSIALLAYGAWRQSNWVFLVLLFLPTATAIWFKTDFKTGDENSN